MKTILKGFFSAPVLISNFFQSFLGTLFGLVAAFIFCGTVFPVIVQGVFRILFFRTGLNSLLNIWSSVHIAIEFYCVYVVLATLITIFPMFSFKGKLIRSGV
ncbi:hypothetical protein LSG23_20580 (plasmid) [Bacillus velezensis]|uniref:hypothetical protein n=1 Tax=Bacillus velezensis TaxID=492670 RepID=UPI000987EEFD|nr:hypothetical protein [Bacillus velezensis]AQS42486.1 hypothetical protein BVH55_00385 [Bacillus velezensis]WNR83194.1 hypothetical protein RP314_20750 [Bacillus velezensis]